MPTSLGSPRDLRGRGTRSEKGSQGRTLRLAPDHASRAPPGIFGLGPRGAQPRSPLQHAAAGRRPQHGSAGQRVAGRSFPAISTASWSPRCFIPPVLTFAPDTCARRVSRRGHLRSLSPGLRSGIIAATLACKARRSLPLDTLPRHGLKFVVRLWLCAARRPT